MSYRSVLLTRVFCLTIGGVLSAAAVHAQGDPVETAIAHVGVGGGISFYNPTGADVKSSNGAAFVYRWHTFHSGWGPTFGLDWRNTDVTEPRGTTNVPLGSLHMRTLLAGVGTTRRVRRLSVAAECGCVRPETKRIASMAAVESSYSSSDAPTGKRRSR